MGRRSTLEFSATNGFVPYSWFFTDLSAETEKESECFFQDFGLLPQRRLGPEVAGDPYAQITTADLYDSRMASGKFWVARVILGLNLYLLDGPQLSLGIPRFRTFPEYINMAMYG